MCFVLVLRLRRELDALARDFFGRDGLQVALDELYGAYLRVDGAHLFVHGEVAITFQMLLKIRG